MGKKFSDKSPLEQTLAVGLYGPPHLKRQERQQLLGQYRERVLKVLTFDQIAEPGTYREVEQAIADPRAAKLIISRKADLVAASEYIRLARKHQLAFTTVDMPEFTGPVGLVVAADDAVDCKDITVLTRKEKLLKAGLPPEIAKAPQTAPLCRRCHALMRQLAPEEAKQQRVLSWFDKLLGKNCVCH